MTSIIKVDNIQNSSGTAGIEINSSGVPLMKNIPHLSVGFNGGSTAISTNNNVFDTDASRGCWDFWCVVYGIDWRY